MRQATFDDGITKDMSRVRHKACNGGYVSRRLDAMGINFEITCQRCMVELGTWYFAYPECWVDEPEIIKEVRYRLVEVTEGKSRYSKLVEIQY